MGRLLRYPETMGTQRTDRLPAGVRNDDMFHVEHLSYLYVRTHMYAKQREVAFIIGLT